MAAKKLKTKPALVGVVSAARHATIPKATAAQREVAQLGALTDAKGKLDELKQWFVDRAWESDEGGVCCSDDLVRGLALVASIEGDVDYARVAS